MRKTLLTLVVSLGCTLSAQASVIQIFYTENPASPSVFSSTYNTTTNTLGVTPLAIGFNPGGADGILIGPGASLIYGGEADNTIFQIPQTGGAVVGLSATTGSNSFLVAINQNNPTTVFDFGSLASTIYTTTNPLPVPPGTAATAHTVTGADTNVSDLFWSSSNQAFYLTGTTGTTGNLGTINLSTFVTTQLFAGIATAQDAVFDPFTGLIVLFGDGQVDTYNPATNTLGTAVVLPGATAGLTCGGGTTAQLDLGTVDGAGHAYVAGCGNIAYIDYSGTGNILSLTDVRQSVAVPGGIKDVAVLPVPSTGTPEPASFALIGFGLLGFAVRLRRKA